VDISVEMDLEASTGFRGAVCTSGAGHIEGCNDQRKDDIKIIHQPI